MPTTQVQLRNGTSAQNNAFTGAIGELTVDTTNWNMRLHNGVNAGGFTFTPLTASGNLNIPGSLSVTGNITGAYILGNGACLSGISSSAIFSGLSNVRITTSGGNIAANVGSTSNVWVLASTGAYVTGVVSASGNVTANYFLGNGACLTGVITSVANINNGNSNVRIDSSGGNVLANVGGTANVFTITTSGITTINNLVINSSAGASEGGQMVLAYKGITGLTGQGNATWNVDVDSSNVFRIFYQDASSNTGVPISVATTGMTVSNVSITGNITGAGMLNPFLLAGM